MRKIGIWCVLLLLGFSAVKGYALSAHSAVVLDGATGRVLFEKNAYEERSMASTTKIMTALVALENGSLGDVVTVSRNASGVEGSSIWLGVGEKISLENLLYGLMLQSGNDAAVAIAEHVGGSVEGFAEMMNQKAAELGANNTHFMNPSGLDQEGHYTTAYDLALITRHAMSNEMFRTIVSTKNKTIPWEGHEFSRTLKNHNKLLSLYEGCDGVKTGFTKKTGRCLVSSATRNGSQLIAVTLNAPDDWNDHMSLLDEAFGAYALTELVSAGSVVKTLPVADGKADTVRIETSKSLGVPLAEGEASLVGCRIELPEGLTAPVSYGQHVGEAVYTLGDCELGRVPLVAGERVDAQNFYDHFLKVLFVWMNEVTQQNDVGAFLQLNQ